MAEQILLKTLMVIVVIKRGSKELTTWTKIDNGRLILEPLIIYVLTRILFQSVLQLLIENSCSWVSF